MNNKDFILLLILATLMAFGVIIENARSTASPTKAEVSVDTTGIRNTLKNAGITPREAKHWKEL